MIMKIDQTKFSINNQSEIPIPLDGKNLQSSKQFFRVSNWAQPTHPPAIIFQKYFPLDLYLQP